MQRTSLQCPSLTDAVEKVADDPGEPFHLGVSVCVSLWRELREERRRPLPRLDATDAQVTHTAGMFIAGRQI
jgi:hypothetical protein